MEYIYGFRFVPRANSDYFRKHIQGTDAGNVKVVCLIDGEKEIFQ
jgi:hypothetical protein